MRKLMAGLFLGVGGVGLGLSIIGMLVVFGIYAAILGCIIYAVIRTAVG